MMQARLPLTSWTVMNPTEQNNRHRGKVPLGGPSGSSTSSEIDIVMSNTDTLPSDDETDENLFGDDSGLTFIEHVSKVGNNFNELTQVLLYSIKRKKALTFYHPELAAMH